MPCYITLRVCGDVLYVRECCDETPIRYAPAIAAHATCERDESLTNVSAFAREQLSQTSAAPATWQCARCLVSRRSVSDRTATCGNMVLCASTTGRVHARLCGRATVPSKGPTPSPLSSARIYLSHPASFEGPSTCQLHPARWRRRDVRTPSPSCDERRLRNTMLNTAPPETAVLHHEKSHTVRYGTTVCACASECV